MSPLGRPDPSTELSRLLSASALIEKRCEGKFTGRRHAGLAGGVGDRHA